MSGKNGNDVQAALVAYSKSKSQLTSLLASSNEIKELEWQGTDFNYPGVRISADFYPAVNGCQDRVEVVFDVFSAEKSSDQASTIAGVIHSIYHRKPFSSVGVSVFCSIVTKISKPDRTIYGWQSKVEATMLIA